MVIPGASSPTTSGKGTLTLAALSAALRRGACRVRGHRWQVFSDGFKRSCARCGREDWLMSNKYPRIGEPALFWSKVFDDGPITRGSAAGVPAQVADDTSGRNPK